MKTRGFIQHLIFSKTPKKLGAGFTLIELLVVISIISMLSSIVLAQVKTARDKAIMSASLQSARNMGFALENCYLGGGTLLLWTDSITGGGNVCSNTSIESRTWPPTPSGFRWSFLQQIPGPLSVMYYDNGLQVVSLATSTWAVSIQSIAPIYFGDYGVFYGKICTDQGCRQSDGFLIID